MPRLARLGRKPLPIPETTKGIDISICQQHYAPAISAVPSIWAASWHVLLMTPTDRASAASTTDNDDICTIDHEWMLNSNSEERFRMTVIEGVDGVHMNSTSVNGLLDTHCIVGIGCGE